jgi:hypothetical protein
MGIYVLSFTNIFSHIYFLCISIMLEWSFLSWILHIHKQCKKFSTSFHQPSSFGSQVYFMKLSTFYNKFYSLQLKMSPKEPNTHLFNKPKELNKKILKALHFTQVTMWFNMHINVCYNFLNESSCLSHAH